MIDPQVGERTQTTHTWFGAPNESQVPARTTRSGGDAARAPKVVPPRPYWLRRIGRVVRDAVIMVAIFAMVPVTAVTLFPEHVLFAPPGSRFPGVPLMIRQADASRPFAVERDRQITPMQAGIALAALTPVTSVERAGSRLVRKTVERPWSGISWSKDMFVGIRSSSFWMVPNPEYILGAAAKGLSPKEMAFLKLVATAPLWREFDLVARAPAVDVLGGRYRLPYPAHAINPQRSLAYYLPRDGEIGISRAAYYLAVGQHPEAEAALKSVIGFGFTLIDNAAGSRDAYVGRQTVEIGRDALWRFYLLTHDPRAALLAQAGPSPLGSAVPPVVLTDLSPAAVRAALLRASLDATAPRAIRYEALKSLAVSSCTNLRELVLGTGPDIRNAYDVASRDFARYPSERMLLDIMLHTTDREFPSERSGVLAGAATVAGLVFHNPRMPFCARAILND